MAGPNPPAPPDSPDLVAAQLTTLLDALDGAVLLLDAAHRVTRTNRAFVALAGVGVAPATLRGRPMPVGPATYQHLYRDPRDAQVRMLALISAGRDCRGQVYQFADGRTIAHDYTPVTSAGNTVGHLWQLREVTAVPPDAGRAAPTGWGEFAATVAHEARTPATSVATFATLLDDPELDAAARHRAVAAICRNVDRILRLAADLRLYSDLELGSEPRGDARVDLPDLIRGVAAGHEPPVPVEICSGPPVTGDAAALGRAVRAAVDVAAALAADGGIQVRARVEPGGWVVTVTGPEQQPDSAERLLSARVPDPDDPEISRSAALVLLLTRAIAANHGGGCELGAGPDGYGVIMRLPTTGNHFTPIQL